MRLSPLQARRLAAAARRSAGASHAPYSRFKVGAAVLTRGGKIFTGCNVENASLGLTLCAERAAVSRAVAEGRREVVAVAVYTPTPRPTPPCGACRQVINEFGPTAAILCVCDSPERIETTLDQLLPGAFGPGDLRQRETAAGPGRGSARNSRSASQ